MKLTSIYLTECGGGYMGIGIIGFLATASGLGVGGILATIFKGTIRKAAAINGICAGILLGLLFIEIIPESLQLSGVMIFGIGVFWGIIAFSVLHGFMHGEMESMNFQREQHGRAGAILALSIAIHNLPLGLSLGFGETTGMSSSLLFPIILHNIPEGLAIFIPLSLAKISFKRHIFILLAVSFPVGLGAILGSIIGASYPIFWAILLSFSIGMIISVVWKEIIMEAAGRTSFLYVLKYLILGMFVMASFLFFFPPI